MKGVDDMCDAELKRLFADLRQGDLAAFERLYCDMSTPLFTVFCRIVQDRALAEDLLQELFLRLYQSPPCGAAHPRAYLFAMARNLAVDALRRAPPAAAQAAEACSDPEHLDTRLDVEHALAQLPELERQILSLHLNAGLKFRELAVILKLPLGTVLWRYQRAIGRMRSILEGDAL